MAIQIPNPGTGNGQTGDNEFVLWSKVKDNFTNTTHAASREVGVGVGNLVEMRKDGVGGFGLGGESPKVDNPSFTALNKVNKSGTYSIYAKLTDAPAGGSSNFFKGAMQNIRRADSPESLQVVTNLGSTYPTMYMRLSNDTTAGDWVKVYTDKNTTLDVNGALKPSSPVLRVFSDCITGNGDGDAMAAEYTKNGVGDYTITGTTGLRTDGWYVVIPNDMNGNPKVAITLDDTDGVITLKTYVRIFDMSTFKFVPDLEQPLDIPDGRWIDLRFNDLPDDAQTEV